MKLVGSVDSQFSPRIEIPIGDNPVEFVVDTGFNGEFMLPANLVEALGFEFTMVIKAELADGSIVDTAVYSGIIEWFGSEREVEVMTSESSDALLGTEMLRDATLFLNLSQNIVELEHLG